jgi:5-oxoprolinase (ATP-hydrolysing) subunit A
VSEKKYSIDLNCDLGEGEPIERTRALMRAVSSANVACGGHAGDIQSMQACVELAQRHNVRLGAHPGFSDRINFGRKAKHLTADELELLLLQQVSALETIAKRRRMSLHHVKLHGGLYHAVEKDKVLAAHYLTVIHRYWPGMRVYARYGGMVQECARGLGVEVWGEAFADRAYRANGTLAPRGRPGAVLTTTERVVSQVNAILDGFVITPSGKRVRVAADTLCLHSDTPNAVRLSQQIARIVSRA